MCAVRMPLNCRGSTVLPVLTTANSGKPDTFTSAVGGILVAAVDPSSSAAAAGVAAGDVVTGISGSDISVMPHADAVRVLQVHKFIMAAALFP